MFRIIKAADRHFNDFGWLQTYWLFSFSDYHDPENVNHGALRVFNDDIVQPNTGFATHPHEEMEIVSIILSGEMTHADTMGNTTIIRTGDIQRMTAGTGLRHSEWNHGSEPVHFFQIWIKPDTRHLTPSYDQKSLSPTSWNDRLTLLAAPAIGETGVSLNTDAAISRTALRAGRSLIHPVDPSRRQFVYSIGGEVKINGHLLAARDQARISDESSLVIEAVEQADLLLIDVPAAV